jgi:dihydroorotate dehydrogenase (fumarate)
MIDQIQLLRASLNDRVQHTNLIAIEMNTSCPNIPSHPPPAYSTDILRPLLRAFADAFKVDSTLTLGLKLAPFVYRKQQQDVLDLIAEFTYEGRNPIAFLTCTNTLGNCTMFLDQTGMASNRDEASAKALPTLFGGLAGEPLHYLSLGYVIYL